MSTKQTKDNDKKSFDSQASNTLKNQAYEKNKSEGKHSYSKQTDHL
jgi:hypothetical protein